MFPDQRTYIPTYCVTNNEIHASASEHVHAYFTEVAH